MLHKRFQCRFCSIESHTLILKIYIYIKTCSMWKNNISSKNYIVFPYIIISQTPVSKKHFVSFKIMFHWCMINFFPNVKVHLANGKILCMIIMTYLLNEIKYIPVVAKQNVKIRIVHHSTCFTNVTKFFTTWQVSPVKIILWNNCCTIVIWIVWCSNGLPWLKGILYYNKIKTAKSTP